MIFSPFFCVLVVGGYPLKVFRHHRISTLKHFFNPPVQSSQHLGSYLPLQSVCITRREYLHHFDLVSMQLSVTLKLRDGTVAAQYHDELCFMKMAKKILSG